MKETHVTYHAYITSPNNKNFFSPRIHSCYQYKFPSSSTAKANISLTFNIKTKQLEKAEILQ